MGVGYNFLADFNNDGAIDAKDGVLEYTEIAEQDTVLR